MSNNEKLLQSDDFNTRIRYRDDKEQYSILDIFFQYICFE